MQVFTQNERIVLYRFGEATADVRVIIVSIPGFEDVEDGARVADGDYEVVPTAGCLSFSIYFMSPIRW